jgi:hypothetical protein
MVPYDGKHFYIFEPVGLNGPLLDIVVPIFFYQLDKILYAKCIRPKYNPLNSGPPGSRDFQLIIPTDIPFNFVVLIDVPVSEFKLIYDELRTFNGDSFVQKCGHQIIYVSFLTGYNLLLLIINN